MKRQTPTEQSPDAFLATARECVQAWADFKFPYAVSRRHDYSFRVGFPLAAHAVNSVQTALETIDRFPWVATANARVAFEHAFTAQWLFLTPDGPQHFMRHASHSNQTRARSLIQSIDKLQNLDALCEDDLLSNFQAYADRPTIPGEQRSWNLETLFGRFDNSGLLYGTYRALSAAVHPTIGTISAHLDVFVDRPPKLDRSGNSKSDRHDSTMGVALAALWALNFVEKCSPEYTEPGLAGAIALPARLPYDLAYSDLRQHDPGAE